MAELILDTDRPLGMEVRDEYGMDWSMIDDESWCLIADKTVTAVTSGGRLSLTGYSNVTDYFKAVNGPCLDCKL